MKSQELRRKQSLSYIIQSELPLFMHGINPAPDMSLVKVMLVGVNLQMSPA